MNAVYQPLLDQAIAAAVAAAKAVDDSLPAEGARGLDCGFAWVDVNPATHPFIRWCKQQAALADRHSARAYGRKHYQRGWQFWDPAGLPTQSVGVKLAGAEAFAEVLRNNFDGFTVSAGSRLD